MELHEKLKEYFLLNKRSIRYVASNVGISETTLSKFLKGNSQLSADALVKVINFFPDIDLNYLFKKDTPDQVNEAPEPYLNNAAIIKEIERNLSLLKNNLAQ
jgi:transcriptional regulator with XRE-family HTH domain